MSQKVKEGDNVDKEQQQVEEDKVMPNDNVERGAITKYYIGENVDGLDEIGVWRNAEVIKITRNKVLVHFSGFSTYYDQWLRNDSQNIQKQWQKGQQFQLNNRVDVFDTYKKWGEARVVAIKENMIHVHYKGKSNIGFKGNIRKNKD